MQSLKKISPSKYKIAKSGNMEASVIVYANDRLKKYIDDDKGLDQLVESATLKGVVSPLIGMPDIHQGYGLPIGGVMAMKAEGFDEVGMVSAGAVGYDINCGVRMLRTDIPCDGKMDKSKLRNFMQAIERRVSTGTGGEALHEFDVDFEDAVHRGSVAAVAKGCGVKEDIDSTEERGCLENADLAKVSDLAVKRGKHQLATLGAGNHFIEIQRVDKIFDKKLADRFGIFENNLSVMIHCGSRGFGHQIAGDYVRILDKAARKFGIKVPRIGLAAAPIDSNEGKDYLAAMACAVNFAFCNRQLIMSDVRDAFEEVFGLGWQKLGMDLVYDVAHNIAKFEPYGQGKTVLVHRKGATRALPAGHPNNLKKYMSVGQPAIVPGDMGRASFVLVGTERARETYYSVNHGAGRIMSRKKAGKTITKEQFERSVGDVLYNTRQYRQIADEAPGAYKDIYEVVETLVEAGIAKKVAMMKPLAVIKGLR